MRKFLASLGASAVVLTFLVAMVAIAAEEMPDQMTLTGCGDKKPPVPFPHKAHFEFATCVDCHHTSEGLTIENWAEMGVETCTSCHANPEEGVPDCSEMSLKKNPFHVSCVDCHKTKAKEAEDAEAFKAPVKCNDCHIKTE